MIERLKKVYENLLDKFFAKTFKHRMNAALADILSEDLAEIRTRLDEVEKKQNEESLESYRNNMSSQINIMKKEIDSMKELKNNVSNEFNNYFKELSEENRKKQEENDKKLANVIEGLEKTVSAVESQIDKKQQNSMKMVAEYITKGLEENREEIGKYIESNKKEFEGLKEMIRQDFMKKTAEISREYKFVEEQSDKIGELYNTIKNRDGIFERNIKDLTEETKNLNGNYKNLMLSIRAMKDVICEMAESKGIELKIAEKGVHLWLYEKLYERVGEDVRYFNLKEITDDIMKDAQKNTGIKN